MRVLEEGTPWSNQDELYIGLIKESASIDTREADSLEFKILLLGIYSNSTVATLTQV